MTVNIPVEPTKYVIKVYDTEAKADTGKESDALYVLSSTNPTIDSSSKIGDSYTINRKYWYLIEANEPVKGIEIDWDDGQDNSNEKGNRELKLFDEPRTTAVFEHYYTKHQSFYPLIRVCSNQNIYSKWYTPFHANNNYRELEENTLAAGNNNKSTQDLIFQKKNNTNLNNLCYKLPKEINLYMDFCKKLNSLKFLYNTIRKNYISLEIPFEIFNVP